MSNESYKLTLTTVEGGSVADVKIWVRFFETATPTRDVLSARNLRFDPTLTFTIEDHNSAHPLVCEVNAPGFRINISKPFRFTAGSKEDEIKLFRDPDSWKPKFIKWNDLGAAFKELTDVLGASQNIRVKDGERFNYFTKSSYDNITSDDSILAKMCLLNLFSKFSWEKEPMGGNNSWFSFVNRIHVFDNERIIAEVDAEMHDIVEHIRDNEDDFEEEYKSADSSMHYGNLRLTGCSFDNNKVASIKSTAAKGNIQLCTTPATRPDGTAVTLLDADIDENGKLIPHIIDVLDHKITDGSTDPIDIHEFLAHEMPDANFGYELVNA